MRGLATERRKGGAGSWVTPFFSAAINNAGDAMNDHCLGWQCIRTELYPFSVYSPPPWCQQWCPSWLSCVCMKEALAPWPVCHSEKFPPPDYAVPKPQLSCSSGRKEELCPAGDLPQLFPGLTSKQLSCISAKLCMFFHFRVAVTFYPLLAGEGAISRLWGCCLQCQGSDEVQPGMDQDNSTSVLSHLWVVSCRSNSCRNFLKSLV